MCAPRGYPYPEQGDSKQKSGAEGVVLAAGHRLSSSSGAASGPLVAGSIPRMIRRLTPQAHAPPANHFRKELRPTNRSCNVGAIEIANPNVAAWHNTGEIEG